MPAAQQDLTPIHALTVGLPERATVFGDTGDVSDPEAQTILAATGVRFVAVRRRNMSPNAWADEFDLPLYRGVVNKEDIDTIARMINGPYCQHTENQVKNGFNKSGSQRYRCEACQRRYTPVPTSHGYSAEMRQQAIQNDVDGMNLRRIGRLLGVDHHTVINWVNAYTNTLPDSPPRPSIPPEVCELDELFTFVEDKKIRRTS